MATGLIRAARRRPSPLQSSSSTSCFGNRPRRLYPDRCPANAGRTPSGAVPAPRRYAVAAIGSETDALEALVEDARSSAAVEREDFVVEPRPVPLVVLLTDAETFAGALPVEHPINLSFSEDLEPREPILADPERVGQVLRNLLTKAAKYPPEGTPVELRVTRLRGGVERVRIEVADRGPGIQPDDVVRIFEKFGRGRDERGRKVAGVDLGLAFRAAI